MKFVKVGAINPPDEHRNRWVEARLKQAFESGLEPVPVPEALMQRFTASLSDLTGHQLVTGAQALGLSPAVYCAQLMAALDAADAPAPAPEETGLIGESEVSAHLQGLLRFSWTGLQDGKIAFAEASTGTGKGRMVAALALNAVAKNKQVLIAAPLNVTRQLIDDLHLLDPLLIPALMIGRANFVDPVKVQAWLDGQDPDSEPAMRDWMKKGGMPLSTGTAQLSSRVGVPLRWLAEDASLVASEEAPVMSWLLDDQADESNPAQEVYLTAQSYANSSAKVIVCSHMMLAVDARFRDMKGGTILPDFDILLVDEAHLLEQAFSAVNSQSLSILSTEAQIRGTALPSAKKKDLLSAISNLGSAIRREIMVSERKGSSDSIITTKIDDIPQVKMACEEIAGVLDAIAKAKKQVDDESLKSLRYLNSTISDVLADRSTIHLSWSPVLHLPSLSVGKANLEGVFERFWQRISGAALVSATLYLPDARGELSAGHLRWVLNVPKARAAYHPPVAPSWVTKSVDYISRLEGVAPDDSDAWLAQVASEVVEAASTAKGGLLVLLTSFKTAAALTQLLEGQLNGRLITQSTALSAASCAGRFKEMHHSGIKPVWLGLGTSAWTGVNLSDQGVSADMDMMLTDVMIPRLPFGCNHTLTHDRRRRQLGMMCEVHETMRLFRQGVGRLVRREGLEHRRLWVTDARLNPKAGKQFLGGFRAFLGRYKPKS